MVPNSKEFKSIIFHSICKTPIFGATHQTLEHFTKDGLIHFKFSTYIEMIVRFSAIVNNKSYSPDKFKLVYVSLLSNKQSKFDDIEKVAYLTTIKMFYEEIYIIFLALYKQDKFQHLQNIEISLDLPNELFNIANIYENTQSEAIQNNLNPDNYLLSAFMDYYKNFRNTDLLTREKLQETVQRNEYALFITVLYDFFRKTKFNNLNILNYEGGKIICH